MSDDQRQTPLMLEQPVSGPDALDELVDLLDLGKTGADAFEGRSITRSLPFVFGGQVAAQALAAAYHTAPEGLRVHSLHAYFVRAGDPRVPLRFEVERVRDGRSFTLRRVVVSQCSAPVFVADLSFTSDFPGLEHALPPGAPLATEPTSLATRQSWLAGHEGQLPDWWTGPMAMDLRFLQRPSQVPLPVPDPQPRQDLWMRADGEVPDEQWVHDCLLAFASDLTLLDPAVIVHGRSWYLDSLRAASLDHSLWFHRPARIDDWLLYEQVSPITYGGRGLATGRLFDRAGTLLASAAQEGLLRLPAGGDSSSG